MHNTRFVPAAGDVLVLSFVFLNSFCQRWTETASKTAAVTNPNVSANAFGQPKIKARHILFEYYASLKHNLTYEFENGVEQIDDRQKIKGKDL